MEIEEKIETILCKNELRDGTILKSKVITDVVLLFESQQKRIERLENDVENDALKIKRIDKYNKYLKEENTELKAKLKESEERERELDNYIITGKTNKTIYLSNGTVKLPDNYEGIDG